MKKTFFLVLALLYILVPLQIALADHSYLAAVQVNPELRPGYAANVQTAEINSGGVAKNILQLIAGGLIYLAGPTGILILAVGGLRYVTSGGKQPAMEAAKKTITFAIVGLIIMALSLAIITSIIMLMANIA